MIENSLLGKLYIYWEFSWFYSLAARIFHFFANAFKYSFLRKLLKRSSRLEEWYQHCLVSKVIDWIIDFVVQILAIIIRFFTPAWESSKIIGLCKGSIVLNFDFLLGAFLCGMYFIPHQYWSNILAVAAAAGLFVIYVFLCAAKRRSVLYPRKLGLPFLIFVVLTPITMLYTTDVPNSFRVLLFFFAAFIFMWIFASNIDSKQKLHDILALIYVIVIFTAIYAIMQRALGLKPNMTFIDEKLNPNMPARVFSTVDNPNNYAELVVLFTPLAAVFAMNVKDMLKRFIACCLLALPMLALVMTYSRSGWLSIALTVFIFVYYTNKKLIPWIFVAAVLATPFLPASVITRLSNLVNVSDRSASFRITLWQSCIRLLSMDKRWLTGIGLGPYTYNHNLMLVTTRDIAQGMSHTQMLYMDLVMEWGILGLISFMWHIVSKIITAANCIYETEDKYIKGTLIAAVSSFLGIAILSVFEYIWFYPRILYAYFILLGLMIACIRMVRSGKN